MRAIVKAGVLWTLGLGVLLAPAVTLALPYKPGKTYCSCGCKTASTTVGLVWELVAHCSLNGHSCKGDGKAGKLETCQKCTAASSTVLGDCQAATRPTVAPPPPTPPIRQAVAGLAMELLTLKEDLSRPDLVPLPTPGSLPPAGFCRRNDQGQLLIQVYNQGTTDAEASKTRVIFRTANPADFDTAAVAAGSSTELTIDIPNACFDANLNCSFQIGVDATNAASESEETNNNAAGVCGPQFQ